MFLFLKCVQRSVDTENLPGHVFQDSILTCPDVKQSDYPPHDSGMQDRVPPTSVFLLLVLFRQRVAHIFQAWPEKATAKKNLEFFICRSHIMQFQIVRLYNSNLYSHVYYLSLLLYCYIQSPSKRCTMTAVAWAYHQGSYFLGGGGSYFLPMHIKKTQVTNGAWHGV